MTTPIFDNIITNPSFHSFPSKSESNITKLEIRSSNGVKQLEVHFASKEDALKFCRENGFIADFAWLKFVTFEGSTLPKVRALLAPYFHCEKVKEQFETLTKQLMVK